MVTDVSHFTLESGADTLPPYVELLEDWTDPLWRILDSGIYWVLSDEGVAMKFIPRAEQRQYLHNLHNRNVTLKSRQHGFTTIISLLQLDHCIFCDNFKALTIAETLTKAMEIFRTKIEFPWSKLPDSLKAVYPLKSESKTEFVWEHGSSIAVGVSGRSGTLQSTHISEMGPIAAKYPEKAREIVTGTFEAVTQSSGIIHVESTGKGMGGRFHDIVTKAQKLSDANTPLTSLDFRLHFYAWWQKRANVLDPERVLISRRHADYFTRLENEFRIFLTPAQRAWYVKKEEDLGEDMKSEHPSYPDEAFEVVLEGAIFGHEARWLRKMGRIGNFPWNPRLAVNTFWDFGIDDSTSIWFHQRIAGMNRMIGFFQDQGMGLGHYVNEMNSYGYTWGNHYIPHDGEQRMQTAIVTTKKKELQGLGLGNIKTVERIARKNLAIDMARSMLLTCEFDAKGCTERSEVGGIQVLDQYQREWDEKLGKYKDTPRHDLYSHGADALMTGAQGYNPDRDRRIQPDQVDDVLIEEVGY